MEARRAQSEELPGSARLFISAIALAGLAGILITLHGWAPSAQPQFILYLVLTVATAGLKVSLPGIKGSTSLSFILIMLGIAELTPPEALFLGLASAIAQSFWNAKGRIKLVHLAFNLPNVALTVLAAIYVYHQPWFLNVQQGELLRLMLAGITYFVVNYALLGTVIALTERQRVQVVVRRFCDWLFLYYLVGVSAAEIVHWVSHRLGWAFTLAFLPPLYLIYRSIGLYFGKMEQERVHAKNMAALHLRTIESLATAIEAKDECTGDHLRRVQVYSLEVAKHLGLSEDQIYALEAASILHDIGKLAVPDYIISKPGKLTPEEFDKMKVHTVVGAEILEQVMFPYPVAPIVRSHHEKWDGSGYPDGLKEEKIPIGARILSAVDCLDALASDRQYRRALPLDEAMNYVAGLSGKSFDPRVVDILKNHYREFESLAQSTPLRNHKLSKDLIVSGDHAPDAGFEKTAAAAAGAGGGQAAEDSIASARQDIRTVMNMSLDVGKAVRAEDILSLLSDRLKASVPYDCLAIYIRDRTLLKARFTTGSQSQRFASLEIPVGQGLSGWVVENGKAIVNGNPSVEPGYLQGPGDAPILESALSVPLGDGADQLGGALTLYRTEKDAYSAEHLRILTAIKGDIARAVEGALRFQKAQQESNLDPLTGLPPKTSLLAHLQDGFVSRGQPVTIVLFDVEDFRRVNDACGRPIGDTLLKQVSEILVKHTRNNDYLSRTGGDEFALLLSAVRPEELNGKVESLDRMIAKTCRELCGIETSGLTAGLAAYPEDGENAETLIASAQRALSDAKHERRTSRNPMLQLEHSVRHAG